MPEYGKKTVVELTEILKRRSLPHTGKKAELVARLNEADKSEGATTSRYRSLPLKRLVKLYPLPKFSSLHLSSILLERFWLISYLD